MVSQEERGHLLNGLHRYLIWVGEKLPEETEAATVLSSTFIPRRIIQPRDASKSQIRFAEDIFSNRPNRSEDKPRKKKKKFSHNANPQAGGSQTRGGQIDSDADEEN